MNRFRARIASWRQFSVLSLLVSLLESFGVLWLATEITSYFSERLSAIAKDLWWLFLVVGLVGGVARAIPRVRVVSRISGTDTDIEVLVGDIFELSGAIIVGTNTTFDTRLDDETISPASVQGQLTGRCFRSVGELDAELERALDALPARELSESEKPYGKRRLFEVGSVASVKGGDRRAHLVAIASMNEHRVASAEFQDVLDALPSLWEHIRVQGGMEPLLVPVLGSGFSRVTQPRERLIQEMIKSFVAAALAGKPSERLTIVLAAADVAAGKIDLRAVGDFLRHECTYAGSVGSERRVGTPAARA